MLKFMITTRVLKISETVAADYLVFFFFLFRLKLIAERFSCLWTAPKLIFKKFLLRISLSLQL